MWGSRIRTKLCPGLFTAHGLQNRDCRYVKTSLHLDKPQGWKSHPEMPWREGLVSPRRWSLRVQKKFSVLTGGNLQKTTWMEAKDPDKAGKSGPLGSR